jgi:hypothetical protein
MAALSKYVLKSEGSNPMLPDHMMAEIARTHPPVLHVLAQRLRQMAQDSGPGTREDVKYGGILFSGARGFCGVFVYAAHVTLEFSEGVSLADPQGELQGKGKGRRHLKYAREDEAALSRAEHFIALARRAADQPLR